MDVHDPSNCGADDQGGTDGGRRAVKLRRRHHRQLREPREAFSERQRNAEEGVESPGVAAKAQNSGAISFQFRAPSQ